MSQPTASRHPGESRDPGASSPTCPLVDTGAEPTVVHVTLGPGFRRDDEEIPVLVQPEHSLFQAIAAQDREMITALCGGCCVCGTCRVRVLDGDPGPMGQDEAHLRRQLAITDPAIRLACQMRPGCGLRVDIIQPE